jgi:ornithine cyclodeaminase/alanine dehydrogenase-like protein (mu-crystallin family)
MRSPACSSAGFPVEPNDHQITLFKLQGTGIMDVAIGLRAYERLKDGNLAQKL